MYLAETGNSVGRVEGRNGLEPILISREQSLLGANGDLVRACQLETDSGSPGRDRRRCVSVGCQAAIAAAECGAVLGLALQGGDSLEMLGNRV